MNTIRLEYLDSLRGIGAVVVALTHLATFLPLINDDGHLFNGVAAVSVFFVLSGYVLSLSLISTERFARFGWLGYTVRRLMRLWVPFAAAVIVALVCRSLPLPSALESPPFFSDYIKRWSGTVTFGTVTTDYLRFYSPNLLAPSWTLRPEFVNSMLLPFGILILRSRPSWFVSSLFFGAYFNALPQGGLHFGLGALTAFYRKGLVDVARRSKLTILAPLIFLIAYAFKVEHVGPLGPYGVWAFLSAALILSMIASRKLQWLAQKFVPKLLGKISFAFYLLHWPLMFVVAPVVLSLSVPLGLRGINLWIFVVSVCMFFTFIASWVFYLVVEKPTVSGSRAVGCLIDKIVRHMSFLLTRNLRRLKLS